MKPYEFFSAFRKAMSKPVYTLATEHRPRIRIKEEGTDRLFSPATLVCYEATGTYFPNTARQQDTAALLGIDPEFALDIAISSDCRDSLFREPLVAAARWKGFDPNNEYIGAKVGICHSVATSEGYLGPRLPDDCPEQIFDVEASRLIETAKARRKEIVIEDLKGLAGKQGEWFTPYKLHYFGERLKKLANATFITIHEINPRKAHLSCEACGFHDKQGRDGEAFSCRQCGYETHADLLAARNIARKASKAFPVTGNHTAPFIPNREDYLASKVSIEPRVLSKAMKVYEFFYVLRQALAKPVYTEATEHRPRLRVKEEGTGRLFSPATLVRYEAQGVYCPPDTAGNILLSMGMNSDLEWEIIYSSNFIDGKLREPLEATVSRKGFVQTGQYIGAKVGITHSVACSDGHLGEKLSKENPEQVFDREAERLISVAKYRGKSIAIESTVEMAETQGTWSGPYKLHYFGERLKRLAKEAGIDVCEIVSHNSMFRKCELCGTRVAKPKFTKKYQCKYCGHETHVGLMVARNLARKAIGVFPFQPKD